MYIYIGEGNGTPLQYSCLENPMDGGAWWAAVHGIAKSRIRLSDFTLTSLSCIGNGNGNPLQYSCLENPRDGEAWWAAVYGVTQSWTQLKWLSNLARQCFSNCCQLKYRNWKLALRNFTEIWQSHLIPVKSNNKNLACILYLFSFHFSYNYL